MLVTDAVATAPTELGAPRHAETTRSGDIPEHWPTPGLSPSFAFPSRGTVQVDPGRLGHCDGLICGVSSDGIDVQVVLGVLGLAAATFSTVWATGGWSALRRRSIQQELDIANDLPASSAARARLTTHVEDEIEIYLYRIREQPPQTIGRPLSRVGLGFLILVPIAAIFPDANIVVIVVVEGLFIAVLVWAYAVIMRSWWIKRSRRRHNDLLEEALKLADAPAAADGQQVELA